MIRILVSLVAAFGTWGLCHWLPEPFHQTVFHVLSHGITMSHVIAVVVGGVAFHFMD